MQAASLAKAPTGIEGFDQLMHGGLPRGRTSLFMGGAGGGKTVFALQSLINGALRWQEPGIMVAFEENAASLRANAASFGWDLAALEEEQLFLLDAHLPVDTVQAGDFDLSALLGALAVKVEEMGAQRIVFDGIDVLLFLLDNQMAERREIYRLQRWLGEQNLTGIITAKLIDGQSAHAERYGFLEFMVDCVVRLEHEIQALSSVRKLRVVKYRGSAFVEHKTPFVIGSDGPVVASSSPLATPRAISNERVSTGVVPLDRMLDGGYYRGTTVLITGAPGTAKTTLAGAFVEAACGRDERALYITFDENAAEIVRNLASVGVELAPCLEAGTLLIHAAYSGAQSTEAHFLEIQRLLTEQQPTCLVIDPLSAILKSGGYPEATNMAHRLLYLAKTQGVTTVCTSLLEKLAPTEASTDLQISTLADTWIQLSYRDQGGERNRALSIIKSRGTPHSNQVRELILDDGLITLAEVYTAGGEVLMGTLRWEKEEALRREREESQKEAAARRRGLELEKIETEARVKALLQELKAQQAELERLADTQEGEDRWQEERDQTIRHMRRSVDGEDN